MNNEISQATKKSVRVGGALLLAAGLVFNGNVSVSADEGGSGFVQREVAFADIAGHWAKASIEQAVKKGYVNGYEDGTFQPNRQISRAEFTKMLVSALKLPVEAGQGGKWYDPYFAAASKAEIATAAEFNNNVDKPLTRVEMARLAMKALRDTNTDAKKWIYLAAKAGIMSGSGAGDIGSEKTTTRAESITVIERILSVKNGAALKADKYAVQAAELYWHKTNIFTVMPEFFVDTKIPTQYNPNNLFIESEDKQYYAVVDAIIAIDLADPKDPNLKLLPPLKNLMWSNNGDGIQLSAKYMDSYIILIKKHVVRTNKKYGNELFTLFYGFTYSNIDEFYNGKLIKPAKVYEKGKTITSLNATIFPKKGLKTEGEISLVLSPPVNNTNAKEILYARPNL